MKCDSFYWTITSNIGVCLAVALCFRQNQVVLLDTLEQEISKFKECHSMLDINAWWVWFGGFPGGLVVENFHLLMQEPQEMCVQSLCQEDPLEEELATHSRILAWIILWIEDLWWVTVHGITKSQHLLKYDLVDNSLETGCFRNSFILPILYLRMFEIFFSNF